MRRVSEDALAWLASFAFLMYVIRSIKQVLLSAGGFWRSPFVMFTAGVLFAFAATAVALVCCVIFLTERCRPKSSGEDEDASGVDHNPGAVRGEGTPVRRPWLLRRGKSAKGEGAALNLVTTHPSAVRQGSYTGPVWLVPATLWARGQLATEWPPPTQGPAAVAHKFQATLVGSGNVYGAALLLVPEHLVMGSGKRGRSASASGSRQALTDSCCFGDTWMLSLEGVTVDLMRDSLRTRSTWDKRCPLQLSHPSRALLLGETTLYMFAESGSAKEQWYAALMGAVAPQSLLATTQHLYEDYCRYMASLQIVQPPPLPPAPPSPAVLRGPWRSPRYPLQQPLTQQQDEERQRQHQNQKQTPHAAKAASAATETAISSMAREAAKQPQPPVQTGKERERKPSQQRHQQQGKQCAGPQSKPSAHPEMVPAPRQRGGRNPFALILSRFGRGSGRRIDTPAALASDTPDAAAAVSAGAATTQATLPPNPPVHNASQRDLGPTGSGTVRPAQNSQLESPGQQPGAVDQHQQVEEQQEQDIGLDPGHVEKLDRHADGCQDSTTSAEEACDRDGLTGALQPCGTRAPSHHQQKQKQKQPLSSSPSPSQQQQQRALVTSTALQAALPADISNNTATAAQTSDSAPPAHRATSDLFAASRPFSPGYHNNDPGVETAQMSSAEAKDKAAAPAAATEVRIPPDGPLAGARTEQKEETDNNRETSDGGESLGEECGGFQLEGERGESGSVLSAVGLKDVGLSGPQKTVDPAVFLAPKEAVPGRLDVAPSPAATVAAGTKLAVAAAGDKPSQVAAPSALAASAAHSLQVDACDGASVDAATDVDRPHSPRNGRVEPSFDFWSRVPGVEDGCGVITVGASFMDVSLAAGGDGGSSGGGGAPPVLAAMDVAGTATAPVPGTPEQHQQPHYLHDFSTTTPTLLSARGLPGRRVPSSMSLEAMGSVSVKGGVSSPKLSPTAVAQSTSSLVEAGADKEAEAGEVELTGAPRLMGSSLLAQQSRHGSSMPDLFEVGRRMAEAQRAEGNSSVCGTSVMTAASSVAGNSCVGRVAAITTTTTTTTTDGPSRRSLDCCLNGGPPSSISHGFHGGHLQGDLQDLHSHLHEKHRHTLSLPGSSSSLLRGTGLLGEGNGGCSGCNNTGSSSVGLAMAPSSTGMSGNLSKQDLKRLQREEQERLKQEHQRAKAAARAVEEARKAEERVARERVRAEAKQRRQVEAKARQAKAHARALKQQLGSAKSLQDLNDDATAAGSAAPESSSSSSTLTTPFTSMSVPPESCTGSGGNKAACSQVNGSAAKLLGSKPAAAAAAVAQPNGVVNGTGAKAAEGKAGRKAGQCLGTEQSPTEPSMHMPRPVHVPSTPPTGALVEGLHGLNMVLVRIGFELLRRRGFSGWLQQLIQSKLDRVRRPGFLDKLLLRRFDLGFTAPQLRNIRAVAGPNNYSPGSSTWPQLALDVIWVGNATATVSTKIDFDGQAASDRVAEPAASGSVSESVAMTPAPLTSALRTAVDTSPGFINGEARPAQKAESSAFGAAPSVINRAASPQPSKAASVMQLKGTAAAGCGAVAGGGEAVPPSMPGGAAAPSVVGGSSPSPPPPPPPPTPTTTTTTTADQQTNIGAIDQMDALATVAAAAVVPAACIHLPVCNTSDLASGTTPPTTIAPSTANTSSGPNPISAAAISTSQSPSAAAAAQRPTHATKPQDEQPADAARAGSGAGGAGRASGKGGGGSGGGGGFWLNFVPFFSILRKAGQALAFNIAGSLSGTPVEVHLQASRFEGTLLLWLAPPPSDRLWMSFAEPPKMQFAVTPVFGSRKLSGSLVVGRLSSWVRSKVTAGLSRAMVYPACVDVQLGKLLLSIDSPGDAVRPFVPPPPPPSPPPPTTTPLPHPTTTATATFTPVPPVAGPHPQSSQPQELMPSQHVIQYSNAPAADMMRVPAVIMPPLRQPARPGESGSAAATSAMTPDTPHSAPSFGGTAGGSTAFTASSFAAVAANGLATVSSSGSLLEHALNHVIRGTPSIWGSSPGTLSPMEGMSDAGHDDDDEDVVEDDDEGDEEGQNADSRQQQIGRYEEGSMYFGDRSATDYGDGSGTAAGERLRLESGVVDSGGMDWSFPYMYGDGGVGWASAAGGMQLGFTSASGNGAWNRDAGGSSAGEGIEGGPQQSQHHHPQDHLASAFISSMRGQQLQPLQSAQGPAAKRRSGRPFQWMRGAMGLVARGVGGMGNAGIRGLGAVGSALGQAMLGPVVHAGERAVVQQQLQAAKVLDASYGPPTAQSQGVGQKVQPNLYGESPPER